MRDILFKGKQVDNGEWVYGFVSTHTICSKTTRLATVIEVVSKQIYDCDVYEVIPETVGQYTGLRF